MTSARDAKTEKQDWRGVGRSVLEAARFGLAGSRPPRYSVTLDELFEARISSCLQPGISVLDIGSGKLPTLAAGQRPPDVTYVGLDASKDELDRAAPGSYDETVVTDVGAHIPSLDERFDLVLSRYVLEHVKSMSAAMENVRRYLKPGGTMVSIIPGAWAAFAVLNRVLPRRISRGLMHMLHGRPEDTVFPAYYDRCSFSALQDTMASWTTSEVVPTFCAGYYFEFSRVVLAMYLAYEEITYRRRWLNLAGHYLVVGTR